MKTKNLDGCVESKSLFTGVAHHRNHPFSKTTPFADISRSVFLAMLQPWRPFEYDGKPYILHRVNKPALYVFILLVISVLHEMLFQT
jgi:hypothetical protein